MQSCFIGFHLLRRAIEFLYSCFLGCLRNEAVHVMIFQILAACFLQISVDKSVVQFSVFFFLLWFSTQMACSQARWLNTSRLKYSPLDIVPQWWLNVLALRRNDG